MKICLAQTTARKGDIPYNIGNHKKLIDVAVSRHADLILFPELSITGYEPALAKELAMSSADKYLEDFQAISNSNKIMIGVGLPISGPDGICISLVFFHPGKPLQVYHKHYIHADEEPFFVAGENKTVLLNDHPDIALAICYEISVPSHIDLAAKSGAKIYLASVAKLANGIEKSFSLLSELARLHHMQVMMVNYSGLVEGETAAGQSSVWNEQGELIGRLPADQPGILICDTKDRTIFSQVIV